MDSLNSYAKYKLLKCQMNSYSSAGLLLEMEVATLFSGRSFVEVNDKVINIQPAFDGKIFLNTLNIAQPLSKQSSIPLDFLPGWTNFSPRKYFEPPLTREILSTKKILIGAMLL